MGGACSKHQVVSDAKPQPPAPDAKAGIAVAAAASPAPPGGGASLSDGPRELSTASLAACDTPPMISAFASALLPSSPPLTPPACDRAPPDALSLDGPPPGPRLDHLTALARQLCGTPMAAVALPHGDALQLTACQGDPPAGAAALCERVFAPGAPSLVAVQDAAADERLGGLACVAGPPHVRCFAAAQLAAPRDGRRLGALCVLDTQRRALPADQLRLLGGLAEACARELELEQALQQQAALARERLHRAVDSAVEAMAVLDLSCASWQLLHANDAFQAAAGLRRPEAQPGSPFAEAGAAAPADFWQTFCHITDGARGGAHRTALEAMLAGQEFMLRVRSIASTVNNSGQPPTLRVLFRPADAGQGAPRVVPTGLAGTLAAEGLAVGGGGGDGGGGAPLLYFAAVQPQDRGLPPLARALSLGGAGSGGLLGYWPSTSDLVRADSLQGGLAGALPRDMSQPLISRCDSSGVLPPFFAMRPEVMSEVTLGPLIGSGSAGRCYRASWQGGRVAVKIIDCKLDVDGGGGAVLSPGSSARSSLDGVLGSQKPAAEAALVEALLARSLSHPHVITTYCHAISKKQVHAAGEWRQQVWIVQEFCARGSLREAIDKGVLRTPSGAPNLPAVLTAAQEMAGALLYLHQNDIVHGDLTPGNVLLSTSSRDARRWVCKVGDFGLAQIIGNGTAEVNNFGTLTHAAPELVRDGTLTKAADVFSFGVVLLEMYNSKRVWRGHSFMQILSSVSEGKLPFVIPPDCPDALASLLRRCLSTDPAQRPAFAAVLSEIQGMLRSLPRAAGGPPPPGPGVSVRRPPAVAQDGPAKHVSPFAQAAARSAVASPFAAAARSASMPLPPIDEPPAA